MQKWNQINKRLKTIIADDLSVAFNHAPVVKKTGRSELSVSFFYVKFNGEIIWQYPKDNAYHNFMFCNKYHPYMVWHRPQQQTAKEQRRHFADSQVASPENIIAGYLDLPKDKLLDFEEPTGLKYILWACDKRIGKQRLAKTEFIEQAMPVIKARVPEYSLKPCLGNSMTLVYTDDEISIFGKSKWQFHSTFNDDYLKAHRFIVTDNPSYSLSCKAIEINFNGQISRWEPKMFSKNLLKITPETETKIIQALKSPSLNIEGKTVFEEIIILENQYPTTKEVVDENLTLFEKIT